MRYTTKYILKYLVSSVLPAMLINSTVGSLRSVFAYEHSKYIERLVIVTQTVLFSFYRFSPLIILILLWQLN